MQAQRHVLSQNATTRCTGMHCMTAYRQRTVGDELDPSPPLQPLCNDCRQLHAAVTATHHHDLGKRLRIQSIQARCNLKPCRVACILEHLAHTLTASSYVTNGRAYCLTPGMPNVLTPEPNASTSQSNSTVAPLTSLTVPPARMLCQMHDEHVTHLCLHWQAPLGARSPPWLAQT